MRANETSAEEKLWRELRNRRHADFKFVRPAPVGPYFVDFLCCERKIIVEIDGGTHGTADEIAKGGYKEFVFRESRMQNAGTMQ